MNHIGCFELQILVQWLWAVWAWLQHWLSNKKMVPLIRYGVVYKSVCWHQSARSVASGKGQQLFHLSLFVHSRGPSGPLGILTVTVLTINSELGVDVWFFSRIWFTLEEKREKYLCTRWITERALYSISSLTLLHFAPGVGSWTTEREKAV